ncbi:hypothetical protein FRC18_005820 [Serendipita sp. 400]|nr:hypothetical protein FRC18_005820 [Serendipita sp. 400]
MEYSILRRTRCERKSIHQFKSLARRTIANASPRYIYPPQINWDHQHLEFFPSNLTAIPTPITVQTKDLDIARMSNRVSMITSLIFAHSTPDPSSSFTPSTATLERAPLSLRRAKSTVMRKKSFKQSLLIRRPSESSTTSKSSEDNMPVLDISSSPSREDEDNLFESFLEL